MIFSAFSTHYFAPFFQRYTAVEFGSQQGGENSSESLRKREAGCLLLPLLQLQRGNVCPSECDRVSKHWSDMLVLIYNKWHSYLRWVTLSIHTVLGSSGESHISHRKSYSIVLCLLKDPTGIIFGFQWVVSCHVFHWKMDGINSQGCWMLFHLYLSFFFLMH